MITLIAAAAEDNALGKDNELLWHLPDDFKRFKKLTTGHHIIMGRKTFQSFPKLLPNRTHVVITRQKDYHPEGTHIVHDLDAALEFAAGDENIFIIGGGEIYALAMNRATHLELTRVNANFENADTFFPEIDKKQWELVEKKPHPKDEKHAYHFDYLTYVKR
ncbi:MAG TPA: dihydrofolate reductase [Leeuwenhoekiella sp.]|nr:dihydrofolate reductase [Leeuwenhoekiella sp.]